MAFRHSYLPKDDWTPIEKRDFSQSVPPVCVGDTFRFINGARCEVVHVGEARFEYKYCNPQLQEKVKGKMYITFKYWRANAGRKRNDFEIWLKYID